MGESTAYEDLSREELVEVVVELEDQLGRMEQTAKKVKADFENYKKEQPERKHRWRERAQKDLAQELIQVLDNLERAIMSADGENTTLLQGVEMVADELYNTLAERGLQRIHPDGDTFDPRIHTAVDTTHHEQDNIVVETRRKGYMYNDNVIREAEVVVGKNNDTGNEHTGNEDEPVEAKN